jgi:hypothetical protein
MSRQFVLLRGGVVLGVVTLDPAESDFPWLVGRLQPSPAYDAVRPLFEEMDRMIATEGFNDESGALHERIMAPGVNMRVVEDGELVEVTGIHISGSRVSWR